jgi:hypothetical protein
MMKNGIAPFFIGITTQFNTVVRKQIVTEHSISHSKIPSMKRRIERKSGIGEPSGNHTSGAPE